MHHKLGFLFVFAALRLGAATAPFSVRVVSTLPSPQPVGTPIGLSPRTENVAKGTLNFRYEVSVNGGPFHMLCDFTPVARFRLVPGALRTRARWCA